MVGRVIIAKELKPRRGAYFPCPSWCTRSKQGAEFVWERHLLRLLMVGDVDAPCDLLTHPAQDLQARTHNHYPNKAFVVWYSELQFKKSRPPDLLHVKKGGGYFTFQDTRAAAFPGTGKVRWRHEFHVSKQNHTSFSSRSTSHRKEWLERPAKLWIWFSASLTTCKREKFVRRTKNSSPYQSELGSGGCGHEYRYIAHDWVSVFPGNSVPGNCSPGGKARC